MSRPPTRRVLVLPLSDRLRQRAAADAARRGVTLQTWGVQTLEAHLAGCACAHAGRGVEPVASAEPAQGDATMPA